MAAAPSGFTFGAALTHTQLRLGYIVNQVESNPLLGTTAPTTPFLPVNADRIGLIIVNTSLNTCFVGLSQTEIANFFGILLTASGGSITMQVRDDFTMPAHEWWGIAQTNPAQLYVIEYIGVRAIPPNFLPGQQ